MISGSERSGCYNRKNVAAFFLHIIWVKHVCISGDSYTAAKALEFNVSISGPNGNI
jgi:hypothetical protein